MNDCYLFDIDGTVADCSHRLHHIEKSPKDWDAFFQACDEDSPIEHICDLVRIVSLELPVVFVSGRSDQCREETEEWLKKHRLWSGYLYMREHGDHRPDDIIKLELLEKVRSDGWRPIMAFDDRDRVVAAWRSAGIPCAQVAPGDF
jgi:phosphoglycolate phosphatase-like HAD superfamily hydrolase